MSRKRILAGALGLVALTLVAETSAFAAPPAAPPASTSQVAPPATRQTAHASIRLDLRPTKAWVGQALPVTLQAYFRGAEGVTLEGTPQLTSSSGIFTSTSRASHDSPPRWSAVSPCSSPPGPAP